jgi:hypothetical protein
MSFHLNQCVESAIIHVSLAIMEILQTSVPHAQIRITEYYPKIIVSAKIITMMMVQIYVKDVTTAVSLVAALRIITV